MPVCHAVNSTCDGMSRANSGSQMNMASSHGLVDLLRARGVCRVKGLSRGLEGGMSISGVSGKEATRASK